jgi:Na+-translocating ferredoxin:NAD+ oxidoreductase RnfG subunit
MILRIKDGLDRMRFLFAISFCAVLLTPRLAQADDVYFTTKSLLKTFFADSEKVTYVKLDTPTHEKELRRALGYLPKKKTYAVFVARTGDRVDGYAFIDDEMGQHEPITFGVRLTPDGVVDAMEVMVYREGYGDEVRERRFKRQFTGKTARDPIALGNDVIAISGATISSKSMTVGVRRAVALVAIAKREATRVAARAH